MVRPPYGRCLAAASIALALSFVGISAGAEPILMLEFWSPSCGYCLQMKPLLRSYEQAGYPIREIDTTSDSQTARQYNVTGLPCFVMLVNGQEVERKEGATNSEGLKAMFDRAKDQVVRINGTRNQSPDNLPANQSGRSAQVEAIGPAPSLREQPWPSGGAIPNERPKAEANLPTASVSAHAALLAATVRLSVDDSGGRSYGTGTIIDTRSGEALVVTCGHLFRESQGKAPVKADLYEVAGDTVRVASHATGQVISYDLNRDVALVSIRADRNVTVVPVAPPRSLIERGDRLVGIGCSNGNDPTVMETRVTSLDRYQGPPNIEASGAPAIGRSGGGLFNGKGELVGICNNADPEGNEGIYAGLQSIHEELDRLGLKEIYAKGVASQPSSQTAANSAPAAEPSIIRGQEPITPLPSEPAPPRKLSANEQAALEEVMSRAVTSEVVCIVRPKEQGGQSEVITLDNVSPEFVRALRERTRPASVTR